MERHISIINQHLSDLNPLICGWQVCTASHSYGPAARDYYLIHYVLSGKGCFCRDHQQINLARGDLFLIRPDELTFYQADHNDPWYYIWIGFDGALCDSMLNRTVFEGDRASIHLPEAEQLFLQIQNEFEHLIGSELFLCAKLFELFSLLQPHPVFEKEKGEYIQRAVDYMKVNYASPIRIEQIARTIGLDRHYLSRIFSRKMGMPPKRYLLELRLNRAAVYLVQRNYSVKEAAHSVGYDDVFNFSKVFKRYYGLAPQNYKQKHQHTRLYSDITLLTKAVKRDEG